jgi:hypothetical protein
MTGRKIPLYLSFRKGEVSSFGPDSSLIQLRWNDPE